MNFMKLISAIERHSKTIFLIPFVKFSAERLSGLSDASLKKFDDDERSLDLSSDFVLSLKHALSFVTDAKELSTSMFRCLEEDLSLSSKQSRKLLT